MKLLTDFPDSDAVSEALRFLRVRSTIYCRSEMRAPWGFAAEAPGAAAFHLVTAGRCWLEVEDEPEPVAAPVDFY